MAWPGALRPRAEARYVFSGRKADLRRHVECVQLAAALLFDRQRTLRTESGSKLHALHMKDLAKHIRSPCLTVGPAEARPCQRKRVTCHHPPVVGNGQAPRRWSDGWQLLRPPTWAVLPFSRGHRFPHGGRGKRGEGLAPCSGQSQLHRRGAGGGKAESNLPSLIRDRIYEKQYLDSPGEGPTACPRPRRAPGVSHQFSSNTKNR
jgi:hypothetical protein